MRLSPIDMNEIPRPIQRIIQLLQIQRNCNCNCVVYRKSNIVYNSTYVFQYCSGHCRFLCCSPDILPFPSLPNPLQKSTPNLPIREQRPCPSKTTPRSRRHPLRCFPTAARRNELRTSRQCTSRWHLHRTPCLESRLWNLRRQKTKLVGGRSHRCACIAWLRLGGCSRPVPSQHSCTRISLWGEGWWNRRRMTTTTNAN